MTRPVSDQPRSWSYTFVLGLGLAALVLVLTFWSCFKLFPSLVTSTLSVARSTPNGHKKTNIKSFLCPFGTDLATRVSTILVLGYWVLGNIHRYWVVLLLGDICCCSDTQYNTTQTAVSTVHMPVNDYFSSACDFTLTAAIVCLDTVLICCCLLNTVIVIIIEFWDFSCYRYAIH